ncbi:MAG TPA: hypothetical protein VK607_10780, partial [Kofleriaceae bacterium]|nr:hypothetical protein [Kofleriaceae bacterium]
MLDAGLPRLVRAVEQLGCEVRGLRAQVARLVAAAVQRRELPGPLRADGVRLRSSLLRALVHAVALLRRLRDGV